MSSSYVNGLVISSAYLNGESTLGYFNGVKIWGGEPVPVPAPSLTLISGNPTFTVKQETAITPIVYEWTNADTVTVSNLHTGLSASIDNDTHRVTISGTPTAKTNGAKKFAVTTSGGVGDAATLGGTITVTAIYSWLTYSSSALTLSKSITSSGGYIYLNQSSIGGTSSNLYYRCPTSASYRQKIASSGTSATIPTGSTAYKYKITSNSGTASNMLFSHNDNSTRILLRDGKVYVV